MIATVMIFLLAVSVLASVAAWTADGALRRLGVSTRWMWLGAMGAGSILLFTPLLVGTTAADVIGRTVSATPIFELAPIILAPAESSFGWATVDVTLGLGWILLSLVMTAVLVRTHRALLSERAHWDLYAVTGREVYLSSDRGPAVAGVLRPWIVLPRWVLDLPETELGLVVLHEEEHVAAGDPVLLASALSMVVLTPWNPVAWWQLRQLRTAMEVDCDRRVLKQRPDRAQYGQSLLAVAARASGPSLGLAAFTERSHSLQRRIVAMTSKKTPWTPIQAVLLLLLAGVVGVQACGLESPVAPVAPNAPTATAAPVPELPEIDIPAPSPPAESPPAPQRPIAVEDGPTFTPFTAAPSVTNRQEVIDAMMAEYPPLLREAGIGGTVRVYFFINAAGKVEETRIDQSSGHAALDQAAIKVAGVYAFTPARNGDTPVPVWVSFGITFQRPTG